MIPFEALIEIEHGKKPEDDEGDGLLNDFQLRRVEILGGQSVCRNHKAIYKKSDTPASQDDKNHRTAGVFVFQMAIPGEGHEDVGYDEEQKWGEHSKKIHSQPSMQYQRLFFIP